MSSSTLVSTFKGWPLAVRGGVIVGGAAAGLAALNKVIGGDSAGGVEGYGSAPNGYTPGSRDGSGNGIEPIPTRLFNMNIPLYSPAASLANKGLNGAMSWANALSGGTMFPNAGRPKLAEKYGILQSRNGDIGHTVANGRFDEAFANGRVGDVVGSNLSVEEKAMIAHLDPKDRARYLLQKKMQEKAQMMQLLSNLASMRHQMAMGVIANIR